MKEMIRLKTITSEGSILLSPFVFKEEEAKRRIKSALKTFEKDRGTRTELLKVSRYPRGAVWSKKKYGKDRKNIERLISLIERLMLRWEVMEGASN